MENAGSRRARVVHPFELGGVIAMAGIFISYRRDDSAGHTGRLAANLATRFGRDLVFQDIASLPAYAGLPYGDALREALAGCDAMLVVIGPHWSTAANREGKRRLDDPGDWVRQEIAAGLDRPGLRVIPVLVGKATLPDRSTLPDDLASLNEREKVEISDARWDLDLRHLMQVLEPVIEPRTDPPPPGGEDTGAEATATGEPSPTTVFISYADEDAGWVEGSLVPGLALDPGQVRTHRDLDLGADKLTEYSRLVEESDYTLLVLTPEFLEDPWGNEVKNLAGFLRVEYERHSLLPLNLRKVRLPLAIATLVGLDFTKPERREEELERLRDFLDKPSPRAGQT
jgi:hypothetical protein